MVRERVPSLEAISSLPAKISIDFLMKYIIIGTIPFWYRSYTMLTNLLYQVKLGRESLASCISSLTTHVRYHPPL
jgi:hypothetical protein